jgi:hypothetical protein
MKGRWGEPSDNQQEGLKVASWQRQAAECGPCEPNRSHYLTHECCLECSRTARTARTLDKLGQLDDLDRINFSTKSHGELLTVLTGQC